jgi:hypothetical protein
MMIGTNDATTYFDISVQSVNLLVTTHEFSYSVYCGGEQCDALCRHADRRTGVVVT